MKYQISQAAIDFLAANDAQPAKQLLAPGTETPVGISQVLDATLCKHLCEAAARAEFRPVNYYNGDKWVQDSDKRQGKIIELSALVPDTAKELDKMLDSIVLAAIVATYKDTRPVKQWRQWLVTANGPGDFFVPHADNCTIHDGKIKVNSSRRYTGCIYLNNCGTDFEGGQLEFANIIGEDGKPFTYVPKAGELVLFPSTYSWTHEVKQITSGIRYGLVNFYEAV
jgi:predicted 2-oxoglutarate/Fe(II)-dependent dioxygenase YbiX